MSQNRQAYLDRIRTDYISKIILRGEFQTRLVNTKMDHLITSQWRRLLEIQEIQVDLLQILQTQQTIKKGLNHSESAISFNVKTHLDEEGVVSNTESRQISIEMVPDEHSRLLLRNYYDIQDDDDTLLFSAWHGAGDNFVGIISNVKLEFEKQRTSTSTVIEFQRQTLKTVVYDLIFEDSNATLDDLFSGEGIISMRNDFDLPHAHLRGRILKIDIHTVDGKRHSYLNGTLPARYKPSFSTNFKRAERITDFWKLIISKLVISYAPPVFATTLVVPDNVSMKNIVIDFFKPDDHDSQSNSKSQVSTPSNIFMMRVDFETQDYLKDISNDVLDESKWQIIGSTVFKKQEVYRFKPEITLDPGFYIFFVDKATVCLGCIFEYS